MRALALLLLAFPIVTLAEEEPSPPSWSLGAGVSTAVIYSTAPGGLGPIRGIEPSPSLSTSLERRLSGSSWLVLGVNGTLADYEQGPFVEGAPDTHWKIRTVTLDVGVRRVLTRPGAVVDVSVLALAEGGYAEDSGNALVTPSGEQKLTSWTVGGNVGIAVDRELTRGLTLRVATPLAGAWWQRTKVRTADATSNGHFFTAAAYLAPRLELRLAF